MMTIFTVQFDYKGQEMYERLVRVFRKSALRVMPEVRFEERNLKCPGNKIPKIHFRLSNTLKLREWVKWLDYTEDNTVFMDCDMLILQDISPAFDLDFDIAYTVRTSAKMPMNGGVIFAKPTEGARKFLYAWNDINDKMFANPTFHHPYRVKYAGMNQAAFGYLLENPIEGVNLLRLPCAVWNSCSEDWNKVNASTRIVHIKSVLRKVVLGGNRSAYKSITDIWKAYENGTDPEQYLKRLPPMTEGEKKKLEKLIGMNPEDHTLSDMDFLKNYKVRRKDSKHTPIRRKQSNTHTTYTQTRNKNKQKGTGL
jgi:hypothetical protein